MPQPNECVWMGIASIALGLLVVAMVLLDRRNRD